MKNAERFSLAASKLIEKHGEAKTADQMAIIRYGLEIIYLNVVKLLVMFLAAFFLGILWETLVVAVVFGVLRTLASGFHAKTTWGCYPFTAVVYLGIPYVGQLMIVPKGLGLVIGVISIIIIGMYAPADTEDRPLINPKQRQSLRLKSVVAATGLVGVGGLLTRDYTFIFCSVSMVEAVLILPFTYKIFNRGYRNYESYEQINRYDGSSC